MSKRFLKSDRLLKRYEFRQVLKTSKTLKGSYISLNYSFSKINTLRLGIVASRKFGKAYIRNRFKRIVREAFRISKGNLPLSLDLVVHPRSQAKTAKMQDIQKELLHLCNHIPLLSFTTAQGFLKRSS